MRYFLLIPGLNPWIAVACTSVISASHSSINPDSCIATKWWPLTTDEVIWTQYIKQFASSTIYLMTGPANWIGKYTYKLSQLTTTSYWFACVCVSNEETRYPYLTLAGDKPL